jgi:outer membrane protein assembly factor BamB
MGGLTLPKNDDLAERVTQVNQLIRRALLQEKRKQKPNWREPCKILQELLTWKSDVQVAVSRTDPEGREGTAYASVKAEAARLIASLNQRGRSQYEALYGGEAGKLVNQGKKNHDARPMNEAHRRFFYTDAGAEATNWLATYALDRGDFGSSASLFRKLIDRDGIKGLSDKTLIKAAYAFHLAGEEYSGNTEKIYDELTRREEKDNLKLGLSDGVKTAKDLQAYFTKLPRGWTGQNASDSPLLGGRPSRSVLLIGAPPYLDPAWKAKIVYSADTEKQIGIAEGHLGKGRVRPVLTSFFPVTATVTNARTKKQQSLLIYRSYWGVHAVDIKTGKQAWRQPSNWGIDKMYGTTARDRDANKVQAITNWMNAYNTATGRPSVVFDNSVLGTFSSDGKRVFAVEDLQVPPTYTYFNPGWGRPPQPTYTPEIQDAIEHNKLQAFDMTRGGKLVWEIGGRGDGVVMPDTYFLGAPLPVGDKLYVLAEKAGELRVLGLDAASGRVLFQQELAHLKELPLKSDPYRRTKGCHLAYAEGILVIPTNAGAVFGLDLLTNSVAWAYPYREKDTDVPPNINPWMNPPPPWVRGPDGKLVKQSDLEGSWKVSPPMIQNGKVIFTAPDAKSIHCVNLRDGSPVWSQARQDDDLYLGGVYNGTVVIVGKGRARGVTLKGGDLKWELETGFPSGQGVAAPLKRGESGDNIYYLPLKKAVRTGKPEICAINIDKGFIHAHVRSRGKDKEQPTVPGNLVFYDGTLLSQTPREVMAFPPVDAQIANLDAKIKDKPEDAKLLADRGDYRLDKGDLAGAIADFRLSLRNKPGAETKHKARSYLYDALTEYFQRDFNKAQKFIKEYEGLCKVDVGDTIGREKEQRVAEERRRKANFLCLIGKGREAQGKLVDAFEKYLELGTSARTGELIQVVDEPSVRAAPDVWAQGRIAAMVAKAKEGDERKALEDLIKGKWKKLQTSKAEVEDLRKFVGMFGSLFSVGKEARLALAERLMENTDLTALLEAEQQLSLLRAPGETPAFMARAIEALARLNTRKGMLEDAAHYYRILGNRFAKVKVQDGKTGSEYLEDLETDKRFLPYLDQPARYRRRPNTQVEYTEDKSTSSGPAQVYQFSHVGERIPFFSRNRLGYDFGNSRLRLADTATGEERWTVNLGTNQFQTIAQNPQSHRTTFSYQTLGHLVVLQLGYMVYGIDPLGKGRVMWEKNLATPSGTSTPAHPTVSVDERVTPPTVRVLYQEGWSQRLGQNGPLNGPVVCLLTRDSLTAVDPVTGRTLWTRSDINSRYEVFGDAENIYAVGMSDDNHAMASRAFRAYDGVSVRLRDFSREYENRVRLLGRNILVSETDLKGEVTMRIYDVLAGKDLWRKKFGRGSIAMRSENPRLTGVAEPDGTVRIIDVAQTKEIIKGKMLARHLKDARALHLMADSENAYVAVEGPPDPNLSPWGGGVQPLMPKGYGVRCVPVNGSVYAFDRKTSKRRWFEEVESSMVVLGPFEDLPFVLFASYAQKQVGGPAFRNYQVVYQTMAVDKRTGKAVYENNAMPGGGTYSDLKVDSRSGKVELVASDRKITFTVVPKK